VQMRGLQYVVLEGTPIEVFISCALKKAMHELTVQMRGLQYVVLEGNGVW